MYDITSQIWAFRPENLNVFLRLYSNRIENGLPIVTSDEINTFRKNRYKNVRPQSESANTDFQSSAYIVTKDNTYKSLNEAEKGSVGVIEIMGAITKYGDMCSYGTKDWSAQLNAMVANSNIDGVVLVFDTPGGSVDGTEDFANLINKARKVKPIVAFADGLMASAGYWLGSQANYIYANTATTSWVGSIGTLIMHVDKSLYLQKEGLNVRILTADRSTEKVLGNSYEPLTPEAEASFKADLNTINDTFINSITRVRGEKITKDVDVFTGATFNGRDAKKYGLIDNIGTFENAVNKARVLAKEYEIRNKK